MFSKLFGWFKKEEKPVTFPEDMDPKDIPAQYWPETRQFVDNLRKVVDDNTIDDPQAKKMNDEILRYIEVQIEKKGYSGTYQEKCMAMEMIADRVLTVSVNKLVGQREQSNQKTQFSDCISQFKKDIELKRQGFENQA